MVGHSLGGVISLRVAIDFPERVGKLVVADSAGLGKEVTILARIASLPLVGELWASQDYRADRGKYAASLRSAAQNATNITDELVDNLYRIERTPDHARIALETLRLWFDWTGQKKSVYGPILQKLPSITNPTLVIWGRQDPTLPLSQAEAAAKRMPNAHLEVIEECGHVPMFEQPEVFNRLVLEFLGD